MSVRNLAIKSSTAIPVVFPPVEIDDMVLVDGGAFQNINIGDPIERCREELGVEDHDIIVDIVMCMSRPYKMHPWTKEKMMWSNALDFYWRKQKLTAHYITFEDAIRVIRANPNVNYRYTVVPTQPPPNYGMVPISATREQVEQEIQLGYDDGVKVIEAARVRAQQEEQQQSSEDLIKRLYSFKT